MKRLLFAVLAAATACTLPATADEPPPAFEWHAHTYAGTLRTVGGDVVPIVGSGFSARLDLGVAGIEALARLEVSRQQDGATATDPNTFQTAETYVALARHLKGNVGVFALYGVTMPLEGARAGALERNPQTFASGLRIKAKGVEVYAGPALHDAAGPGLKGLLGAAVDTGWKTSTAVEVVQPGGAVRLLARVKIR